MDIRTKCQNSQCGTPLKFGVTKMGRVSLSCPKCGSKQAFFIDANNETDPPSIIVKGMGIASAEGQQAKQPVQPPQVAGVPTDWQNSGQPKADAPEQPAADDAIELDEDILVGKEMIITCPHCQAQLKMKATKEGKGKMQCGKCKGSIGFKAVSRTVINFGPQLTHNKRGRLVKVNGFLRRNEVFRLRDGKNVIGRYDQDCQSDIAISGDGLMSRRSVEIEVVPVTGGFSFKFTILKSTNPVVYNKKEYRAPYSREIKFGDTFVLGETTFRFESED